MGSGKINITISGGSTNIGNISQGDQNTATVQEQSVSNDVDKAFSEFFFQIETLSASKKIHKNEIDDLRKDIASLKDSMDLKQKSKVSLGEIAKLLYEEYGWAVDALKKLFTVLIP